MRTQALTESRWRQLKARQLDPGESFLYAVRTTGVYCRIGCSSRQPLAKNVEFFSNGVEAQAAGYRACRRCRPDDAQSAHPAWIATVCAILRSAEGETVSLAALAEATGLSSGYVQRGFKKVLGVSPKEYARQLREERFREALDAGEAVTTAVYSSGFTTPGRAYAQARLGMTPSARRRGGPAESIEFAVAHCWLGAVCVAATRRGICAVEFGEDDAGLADRLRQMFPKARISRADAGFAKTVETVLRAIEDPAAGGNLPLDIRGTAFQTRVWNELARIKPGETASYGEVARRLGSPRAARAVASACASNRLAVLIPCHRVVRKEGEMGGYRWGVERKAALLDRERVGGE